MTDNPSSHATRRPAHLLDSHQARSRAIEPPPEDGSDRAAQIRAAYKTWPNGTLAKMLQLSREHPSDPEVQFTFGVALLWGGYGTEAGATLETAKRLGIGRQTLYNKIKAYGIEV